MLLTDAHLGRASGRQQTVVATCLQDAGADASYVEAPRSDFELQEVAEKTKV